MSFSNGWIHGILYPDGECEEFYNDSLFHIRVKELIELGYIEDQDFCTYGRFAQSDEW